MNQYCENYKLWKTTPNREVYWEDKQLEAGVRETWARLRCGNLDRTRNKGFVDKLCRLCKEGEEELVHIKV